jgi:hypothetical protein
MKTTQTINAKPFTHAFSIFGRLIFPFAFSLLGIALTSYVPPAHSHDSVQANAQSQADNGSRPLAPTSASTSYTYTSFLPLVSRPHGTIYGRVFEQGAPVAGISVTLEFCYDYLPFPKGPPGGYCEFQFFDTTTNQDGEYGFLDMPTLVVTSEFSLTQTYQVHWTNYTNNPNRLAYWDTRVLDSYALGDISNLGDFDISNVALLSPKSDTIVSFPAIFSWRTRADVTQDSYGLCVFGGFSDYPGPSMDMVGCNQPLGYVDSYVIQSPFEGIDYGYGYWWWVEVFDQSGGIGGSYSNAITFAPP